MTPVWVVVALYLAANWRSERRARIHKERLLGLACETLQEALEVLEGK